MFGPVMVLWFILIAALGVSWIVVTPSVVGAIDPRHAITFFRENGYHGFVILGAVFLVVTGGEALYADMGHFGRRPIRLAWFGLVLPALLLNYFGQGAMLLQNPEAAAQPFFLMTPSLGAPAGGGHRDRSSDHRVPGTHLGGVLADPPSHSAGILPASRCRTHVEARGRPNLRSANERAPRRQHDLDRRSGSDRRVHLAAAYGIAVTMTMVVTAILLHVVAVERWKWPLPVVFAMTTVFLTIDFAFLGSQPHQDCRRRMAAAPHRWGHAPCHDHLEDGTSHRCRASHGACTANEGVPGADRRPILLCAFRGTAVFMTAQPTGTPVGSGSQRAPQQSAA